MGFFLNEGWIPFRLTISLGNLLSLTIGQVFGDIFDAFDNNACNSENVGCL